MDVEKILLDYFNDILDDSYVWDLTIDDKGFKFSSNKILQSSEEALEFIKDVEKISNSQFKTQLRLKDQNIFIYKFKD